MNLYDLFQLDEGYTVTRGIDKDRYQERSGLEGPFQTKSGKVVYYDKKEGRYYDPDTDMYIDHEDYAALDEGDIERKSQRTARLVNLIKAKYPQADSELEAIVMHFTNDQVKDRSDINTLYRQNDAEEAEIDDIQAQLDKLKSRRAMGEEESNKDRAERAAMAKIQDQFKDMPKYTPKSAEQRTADAAQSKADEKQRAEQLAAYAEKLAKEFDIDLGKGDTFVFLKGVKDGKNNYRDPKASDAHGPRTWAYDAGVSVGEQMRSPTNEDYYDTDEQRELARLGRIIMDMGAKRDDDIGAAMGAVGMELTKYGTPQGVSSIQKLEKVTGQPESVIMKMMALAQKVQGDVAVGDETASDDEEIEEADFDTNFKKRIGYTVRGGAASDMMKKQAAQAQADNPDSGTGLGPSVLNIAKARKKAAEKGVRAPSNLRSSPNTKDPKRLPEGLDHDIKIGDTVETLKMGQMQGTVTGFSTKYGDTRVMFKHKSGKVYATPASNLKVIDTVKKTESQVAENIDLRHNLQPGTYKHNEENITVTINSDNSVSFKQPAEWEIEGDGEYLEFVEAQLADAGNWTAVVEEAKKKPVPTDPSKWSYYKGQAKKKFDVYPSAYANAWAAKQYKAAGGGWRMGKPKK